ncbi:hypothetical protein [Luteolibacter sp. Populi]|uniref:hypothetical protein n=1 Tax=Luteolibacter sp. Populi TaxID=3230487 RepID=UPI003464F35E
MNAPEPYRPEKRGPADLAQRCLVIIPLLVPGIALAGLYSALTGALPIPTALAGVLPWGLGIGFVLLLIGCCAFAGRMATGDAEARWRRQDWLEAVVTAGLLQIVIAPIVAGILIVFFLRR